MEENVLNVNKIDGTDEPNNLKGTYKSEWISAEGGNDIVHSSGGNDTVWGGEGNNLMDYSKNDSKIKAEINGDFTRVVKGPYQTDPIGPNPLDRLKNMNMLKGSDHGDEIDVSRIKGEMYIDGGNQGKGEADLLNIRLREGGTLINGDVIPDKEDFKLNWKPGVFEGRPYEAILSDENGNTLYINDIEQLYIDGELQVNHEKIYNDLKEDYEAIKEKLFSENPESTLENSAIAHETLSVPISDSIAMLDKINSGFNGSDIDSALKDVLEHEGAKEMLENLEKDGLENLGVPLQDDASPEEFIEEVLMAAHKATIERGLDMPGNTQDNSNTEYEVELSNTNDDFGIV